jgi:cytochrome c-type biogenesis protein CcmH
LLADHADVLAMLHGQSTAGEPTRLIEQALKLDPKNLKALALAGSAAFERKDFAVATQYWTQARALAPNGSEFASGLERSLEEARAGAATQPGTNVKVNTEPQTDVTGSSISGVVNLSPSLTGKVRPEDTVFIFARAAAGPRIPLAILRHKAGELPINFKLDDSTAMSVDLRLSRFAQVTVGARISRSGNAMPQSGDLLGQTGPVQTGSGKLTITIDSIQP